MPTKVALSLLLLGWTRERRYNKRLVGQDQDREIIHQVLSLAKQT